MAQIIFEKYDYICLQVVFQTTFIKTKYPQANVKSLLVSIILETMLKAI